MGNGPSSHQCPQCKSEFRSKGSVPSGTICDTCARENRTKTAIRCNHCGVLFHTVGNFDVKDGFVHCNKCGNSVRNLVDSGRYQAIGLQDKNGKVFHIIFPTEMQNTIRNQIAHSGFQITYK